MSLTKKAEVYSTKYHEAVEFAVKQNELHWIHSEIKLQEDVNDWKTGKVTEKEKKFILNVLRLFTQSDYDIASLYADRLIPYFKNAEVRAMLGAFANIEFIHYKAYALFNDTLGFGEDFYYEFKDFEAMQDKVAFMVEDVNMRSYTSVAQYLAKQCLMEGVGLFASFAMLLNFERFGKLKGFADINLFSARDESLHSNGLAWLFREFCDEHPKIVNDDFKSVIYETAIAVVELEDAFVDKAFEFGDMEGMTKEEIKLYVRFVCDYRMQQLGLKPVFNVLENPIPWIDWSMSGVNHVNFFERETTDYSKDNTSGDYQDFYKHIDGGK